MKILVSTKNMATILKDVVSNVHIEEVKVSQSKIEFVEKLGGIWNTIYIEGYTEKDKTIQFEFEPSQWSAMLKIMSSVSEQPATIDIEENGRIHIKEMVTISVLR